ncbi:MAG: two-component sensor histidine kinase [Acidobacteria bacterium]|nr:MAG: two-component sensor histidine kinase [Acidobacteriota bacterium]
MIKLRLRTKLLLSLMLCVTGLTGATLLIVRSRLSGRARQDLGEGLMDSVATFQTFERQREQTLAQSAGLLANLPSLKALMTTEHPATIQDASEEFWKLSGSDLFVMADRSGKIMALHTSTPGFDRDAAAAALLTTLNRDENRDWWYGGNHLYEVFFQPLYFGSARDGSPLGVLAVGYEINGRLAADVSRIASCQVAFRYGNSVVVSTLPPDKKAQLAELKKRLESDSPLVPQDVQLGNERFLGTTVSLAPGSGVQVSLSVLKSYDQATLFLDGLNRLLLGVGLAAVLAGAGLVFLISHNFTKPLAGLLKGVHALEKGDFGFPLRPHGPDELAELTTSFDRMREGFLKSQQELLHAERLATIGRMASSISHDLRHPLTAILAYAEFLAERSLGEAQRSDLYREIRDAVGRMTELISSLLEFSRSQPVLQPIQGDVAEVVERVVRAMRFRAEFGQIRFTHVREGPTEARFDPKKLERALYNLVLNACEAVPLDSGKIDICTIRAGDEIEIIIADNGPGIPEGIRDSVFQPFVSHGKENGTGLGLAVAQKVVRDHGGDISIDSVSESGTVFKVRIPMLLSAREDGPVAPHQVKHAPKS